MKIEDFHGLFTDDLPVTVIGDFGTVRDYWYADRILALMDREVKSMGWEKDSGFHFWVEDLRMEVKSYKVIDHALKGFDICASVLDKIPDTDMKISVICMLIDHVCERGEMDKKEVIDAIADSVKDVNKKMGDMYESKED